MSGKANNLLILFLIWFVYITIGVFIFKAVEGNDNIDSEKTNADLLEKLKRNITANYNMSGSEFDNIVQQIQELEVSSSSSGPEWNTAQTISFIIQLLTTIGEGQILCDICWIVCPPFCKRVHSTSSGFIDWCFKYESHAPASPEFHSISSLI